MSYIGKNIKKIRTIKKLSQADFAKLFDMARPSIGAYEEGRAEPKIDTIIQIAKKYGLSIDLLLTKELTINELFNFDIFKKDLKDHTPTKVPPPHLTGIPMVSALNSIEYVVKHKNQDFVNTLPTNWIQKANRDSLRAFEITGTEMEFHEHGLHHGDILVTKKVEPAGPAALIAGRIYVIVGTDQIRVRRLAGKKGGWLLRADNPNYEDLPLDSSEVLETWEAIGVYSSHLSPPEMIERRLMILEQKFESLHQSVTKPKRT